MLSMLFFIPSVLRLEIDLIIALNLTSLDLLNGKTNFASYIIETGEHFLRGDRNGGKGNQTRWTL